MNLSPLKLNTCRRWATYPPSLKLRDGANYLRCNLRDFPDKVINNPDFLHFLAIHLFDLANQDFADEPIQYGLVQLLNGGVSILIY